MRSIGTTPRDPRGASVTIAITINNNNKHNTYNNNNNTILQIITTQLTILAIIKLITIITHLVTGGTLAEGQPSFPRGLSVSFGALKCCFLEYSKVHRHDSPNHDHKSNPDE